MSEEDKQMEDAEAYPENGGGQLPDPRETYGQKMPFPTKGNLTWLQ